MTKYFDNENDQINYHKMVEQALQNEKYIISLLN